MRLEEEMLVVPEVGGAIMRLSRSRVVDCAMIVLNWLVVYVMILGIKTRDGKRLSPVKMGIVPRLR